MMDLVGNHLWQSTLFAAAAALLTLFFRNNHARVRYGLWLAASIKFLIPFSLFIAIGSSLDVSWRHGTPLPPMTISYVENISQPFGSLDSSTVIPKAVKPDRTRWIQTFLYAAWLCGIMVVSLLYLMRGRRLRSVLRRAQPLQDGRAHELLRNMTLNSQLRTRIKLASSDSSMEPGVFGIFRPMLLLPEGMIERLDDSQLEAIIAHEVVHVRRHDNFISAIHMIIEALFWFHPMIWWLGAKLVHERERACDEEVLRLGRNPQSYAEGILKVCEFCLESPLACVAGVTGSDMKKRIQAIMTHHIGGKLGPANKLVLATACFTALALPVAIGILNAPSGQAQSQAGPKPSFEVASVKQDPECTQTINGPNGQAKISKARSFQPGGRYSGCGALKGFITDAYEIDYSLLSGGPGWADSVEYRIEAKAERADTGKDQMRLMLQSLLEDRFKLKIHRETREENVYSLVVAKDGPKLQQAKDENGNPIAALPDLSFAEKLAQLKASVANGSTPLVTLGSFGGRVNSNGSAEFTGRAVNLQSLAKVLSGIAGRKVVDKTGITGLYDIQLPYAPGSGLGQIRMMQSGASGPSGPVSAEPSAPSIFTSIQEQLGLKLEPDKASFEYIIIDSVEKPSEN